MVLDKKNFLLYMWYANTQFGLPRLWLVILDHPVYLLLVIIGAKLSL